MTTLTSSSLLAAQQELITAASEAIPHSFTHCTYPLGVLRQPVYLCLTCAVPRGVCASCSVACHTDHDQLELFHKRAFRCDCPTSAVAHPCTLHHANEEENTGNVYGQNFSGAFCRCGRSYDPMSERETMIQCLACEDWFHESCLNLRERPSSREASPVPSTPTSGKESTGNVAESNADDDDDGSSTSSSALPPPLIRGSDYDALICSACIARLPLVRRYAGTLGAMIVLRSDGGAWRVHGALPNSRWDGEDADVDIESTNAGVGKEEGNAKEEEEEKQMGETVSAGAKRTRSSSSTESDAKRVRVSCGPSSLPQTLASPSPSKNEGQVEAQRRKCTAPSPDPLTQAVYASLTQGEGKDGSKGMGDVFLTEEWRERWCRCSDCLPLLETAPYLLEEEETYEPPEDPDSGLSLEELGMRALARMPRDRALDGIRAFNAMRDELLVFLRPFAQEDRVVDEAAVRAFFEAKKEARG